MNRNVIVVSVLLLATLAWYGIANAHGNCNVQEPPIDHVVIAHDGVYVRLQPSHEVRVISIVSCGDTFEIVNVMDEWVEINFHGYNYYVYRELVDFNIQAQPTSTPMPAAQATPLGPYLEGTPMGVSYGPGRRCGICGGYNNDKVSNPEPVATATPYMMPTDVPTEMPTAMPDETATAMPDPDPEPTETRVVPPPIIPSAPDRSVLDMYDDDGDGGISCPEARRHGIAPVRRGDPAYPYMTDRYSDGIICE